MNNIKKKIFFIASSNSTIDIFLRNLILDLEINGYEIFIVTNLNNVNKSLKKLNNIHYINLNIQRKIRIFDDFISIIKLLKTIFKYKPSLSISITPKAGFYNSIVSFFLKNNYLHFFTGQIWINKKNYRRFFFKKIDKFIYNNITHLFADSKSQIDFLISQGFKKKKINLINNGSICGVDTNLFSCDKYPKNKKIYQSHNDRLLIGYIGRLNYEKGILNLINCFSMLIKNNYKVSLILVGNDENNIINVINNKFLDISKYIIYHNFTNNVIDHYKNLDIFCCPSYREGFGLSVIEASSFSIPVIGSNIVGLRDSIANNETGLLFDPYNSDDFYNKMKYLLDNKSLRIGLGQAGRKRVKKYFEKKEIVNYLKKSIIKIIE